MIKPFSVRRNVDRRILRLSLWIGVVGALLALLVCLALAYPTLQSWKQINSRTLREITCTVDACDTTVFSGDWQISDANYYVIDLQARYFINVPTSTVDNPVRFKPLDYSDLNFIARFREPMTYNSPNGELWRLLSRKVQANNKNLEIVVGYAEKAPWKIVDLLPSQRTVLDAKLKYEADKVATILAAPEPTEVPTRGLSADGFAIIDAETGEVLQWGPAAPILLSKEARLPNTGCKPYIQDGNLFLVQTDRNERILVSSLVPVGNIWWLASLAIVAFVGTCLTTRAICRRFLRSYFALRQTQLPNLQEAIQRGEDQNIEFKRGFSTSDNMNSSSADELIKSVAAFANTNDGVIFIGVDDYGHIRGLGLDLKGKDQLEQRIRQLVRHRVKPFPPIHITFEDIREFMVARVTVARGDALVYMIGGAIYLRSGSSDVLAEPNDLTKLLEA